MKGIICSLLITLWACSQPGGADDDEQCAAGYIWDGAACVDVDECALDNGGCGDPAQWSCDNMEGSAPVCTLLSGCAADNGGCGDPQYWLCSPGAAGGVHCSDLNECATDNGGCGDPATWTCVNQEGGPAECLPLDP